MPAYPAKGTRVGAGGGGGGGGGGSLLVDALPVASEALQNTVYIRRGDFTSHIRYARPVPAIPASMTTQAYDTSVALRTLSGSFLGVYASAPDVPTANGVSTYYNSTDNSWYYIVVPFQTSWQAGDSDDLSGRTWLTQTSYAAVIAHLDGGTYDSTLTYAYYAAVDDAIYEVASFTDSVAAVAASLTDRDFVSADVDGLGTAAGYVGASASPPAVVDLSITEVFYSTVSDGFFYRTPTFDWTSPNPVIPTSVGFDRWLGPVTEAEAVSILVTAPLDTSEITGFFDTGDVKVKVVTGFIPAVAGVAASMTTTAYDTSAAFGDLTGTYEGITASTPAISPNPGTYTYYSTTDEDWYYVVVPFQSAWSVASGGRDLASGRSWFTETSDDAVATLLDEDEGYDASVDYAFYDSDAGNIVEAGVVTPLVPATTVPDFHQLLGELTEGPETNEFATTALRDSYASSNPAWLASYNGTPSFYVTVTVGGSSTYYNRIGGNWNELSFAILDADISAAEDARDEAEAAQTAAETAETNAETAQTASEIARVVAETAQTASETAETNAETAQAAAEAAAASTANANLIVDLGSPTSQVEARLNFDAPDGFTEPTSLGAFYAFTTGTINYDTDGTLVIRIGTIDRNVYFDLLDLVQLTDLAPNTPYLVHAIGSQLWMLTPSVHHRNILDATISSWNGAILELSGFRNNMDLFHRPLIGDTIAFTAPLIASDRIGAAQVQFDINGVGHLYQLRDHLNRTIPANEIATRQTIVAVFSGHWYAAVAGITSRDLLPETTEATRGYSVRQHSDDEGYGLVEFVPLPTTTPATRGYTLKQSETDETFELADVVIPIGSSSSGGGYGHFEYHLYQWASASPTPPLSPYDFAAFDFRTDFGDWEANRGTAEAAQATGEIEYIATTYMDILSDGTVILSTWNINIAFDHQWSEDGETWAGVFSATALFERFRLADGNWSSAIRIANGIDGWVNLISLTYNYITTAGQEKAIILDDAFNATHYNEMRIRIRSTGSFGSDQRDGGTAEATFYRPHRFGAWTIKNIVDNDNNDVELGTIKTHFDYRRGLDIVAATGEGMDASLLGALGPEGNLDANAPRAFGWLMHIVANSTVNLNDIKKFRFSNFNRQYARAELSLWVR